MHHVIDEVYVNFEPDGGTSDVSALQVFKVFSLLSEAASLTTILIAGKLSQVQSVCVI